MLVMIIRMPRTEFDPFRATGATLFDLFNQTKAREKRYNEPAISYFTKAVEAQAQIDQLKAQSLRFLVLEMAMLMNRYEISMQRQAFINAITHANFYRSEFQQTISVTPTPHSTPASSATTPFSQIIPPSAAQVAAVSTVVKQLGDNLPDECLDPISAEPLVDPIEINHRVYNRNTLVKMIDQNGMISDPFTRELINPKEAKPAHFMFDAILQHAEISEGKKPNLIEKYVDSKCLPLKALFEQWEQMLRNMSPRCEPKTE